MPVKVKRTKKGKQAKGKRVATAPTRDVIINITTARPRARGIVAKTIPKRNEDLTGRLKDFEISQQLFKQTRLIKETAERLGIFDKRLSVLSSVINGDKTPPLILTPPTEEEKSAFAKQKETALAKTEEIFKQGQENLKEIELKKRMSEQFKKEQEEEKGAEERAEEREDEDRPFTPPKRGRGRKPLTAEEKRQREEQRQADKFLTSALKKAQKDDEKREASLKKETP